jgi:hypothetical protein
MKMYNPYDLVPMLINGQELTGRPIEFDSDVVDQMAMTNAFGAVIKPTKLSTVCPDCGQGLEVDVLLGEPPFSAVESICYHCNPEPPPQADPFMNPVDEGRIASHELDPLLHDPASQVVADEESSVADRFQVETIPDDGSLSDEAQEKLSEADQDLLQKAQKGPKKTAKEKGAKKTTKAKKVKKKAKKKPKKPPKPPVNKNAAKEPAEGVGEEVDFDDEDMVVPE